MLVADDDRIRHLETFDVADAEQALARFEELCADREREPGGVARGRPPKCVAEARVSWNR